MTTRISALGADTPGLTYINSSGATMSAAPGHIGSAVQSQSGGVYSCSQATQVPSNNSKVVQRVYGSVNTISPVPNNAGGLIPFNPANVVASVTITPTSSTSTINIELLITMSEVLPSSAGLFCAGVAYVYVNGATIPAPFFLTQVNGGFLSGGISSPLTYPAIGGASILASNYTSPITISVCPYNTGTGGTDSAGQGGDYLTATEVLPQIPVTMNQICISTSATPVLAFSVPLTASSNTQVTGTFSFFDVNNAISSVANFQMVAQQPASGTATIAQNVINVDSVYASPTLQFTPGVNVLNVSVIGSPGNTYQCQFSHNAVVVG